MPNSDAHRLNTPSVPREPTEAMSDAGRNVTGAGYPYSPEPIHPLGYLQVTLIWRAMYDAAPDTRAPPLPAGEVGVEEALRAANILLEACSTEFGNQPDAPDDATVTGDPECEIKWRHIRRLGSALDALATPSPATERGNGYIKAFYEVADLLGIGARFRSPKEVWEGEMRPRLFALLAGERETLRQAARAICLDCKRGIRRNENGRHEQPDGTRTRCEANPVYALASTPPQPEVQVSGDLAGLLKKLDGLAEFCGKMVAVCKALDEPDADARAKMVDQWSADGTTAQQAKKTLERLTAQVARMRAVANDLISEIGEWARPTSANGMVPAGEDHPLCRAVAAARQAISNEGEGKL